MGSRLDDTADEEQELLYMEQRRALNNAYGALQGQALAESFSVYTIEEAMDEQISRIEGTGSQQHPGLLARIESIRQNTIQAVRQLKEVPPEKFLDADLTNAVNTPAADPLSDEEVRKRRLQDFEQSGA